MVKPNEYHLITFDPGAAATGWTHFVVDFRAFSRPENKVLANLIWWDCGEFTGHEHEHLGRSVGLLETALCDVSYLTLDVVGEGFELTQMIGGDNLLSPVRFNAVMDWECRKRGMRYQIQKRQMRTRVTKNRLKLFGFTDRFRKDEFSAMQHAIVWLRRKKKISLAKPWKLSSGDQLNAHWDCRCENWKGKWARRPQCDLVHPK